MDIENRMILSDDFDGDNEDYYMDDLQYQEDEYMRYFAYEREQEKIENEFYQYFKFWDKEHYLSEIEYLKMRCDMIWTISDYYDFGDIDWTSNEDYRTIFERDDLIDGYAFSHYLDGKVFLFSENEMLEMNYDYDDIPF